MFRSSAAKQYSSVPDGYEVEGACAHSARNSEQIGVAVWSAASQQRNYESFRWKIKDRTELHAVGWRRSLL